MSLSNLLIPNSYNLFANSLTAENIYITGSGSNTFYSTTDVTNMKINHYNGTTLQSDNLAAVHLVRIGKVVYCRLPAFTTVNVQSGAAEGNFLYVWPLPSGFFDLAGRITDTGVQWLQVPNFNSNGVSVNVRYEPNINNASAGVVNQPGLAITTNYNDNTDTQEHWPANTHFKLPEPLTISFIIN